MGFFCGFLIFFLGSLLIYDRLTRKYLNPYRLYLVFGKKGSGKSTYLVKMALKYSRRGWTVYSNMPDLAVPGVRLIDIEQLGDFVPVADSVLLLDEVGMIWDSRDFKRFKNSVRDFFKLQRHYRCIVYMASQTFDVDKKIRDLCDGMYLHINIGRVFSMGKRIEKSICLTEATADSESRISENLRFRPFWNWTMTLIPRYAKFFDSHVLPDMPELPYTVPVPMIERGGFSDTSPTQQNKNFVELRGGVSPSEPGFWRFEPFWDWLAPVRCIQTFFMDYRTEAPAIIRDFLSYHETIQGHSRKTVDEYFLDLRNFFRYIKIERGCVPRSTDLDQISIDDLDLDLVRSVKLSDVYSYMNYLSRDRAKHANSPDTGYGLTPAARARKIAAIRSFYKYITSKAKLMDENPMQDLDSPRLKKALPHYLSLDESIQLLESVDGENKERDYCILIIFLNCGLRISELVGLNLTDIRNDQLRVLGKGNKERILFLNEACRQAIDDWLAVRGTQGIIDKNALFITRRHTRMTTDAVHYMIKKRLTAAGLDASMYSAHKLRHTAATLMLQNGVDVRTLQEVLGHDHLNTTQIYTHVDSDDLRTAAKANPLGRVRRKKSAPSPLPDGENKE